MAGLLILALAFVLWPLVHHKRSRAWAETETARRQAQLEDNVALFHEHLAELDENRRSGAISEEQFTQVKLELERSLLEDERNLMAATEQMSLRFGPRGLVLVSLAVVVGALGIYFWLGASQDVYLQRLLNADNTAQQRDPDPERLKILGEQLEKRLERTPDNLQYWFLLARNAMEQGDFAKAVDAYRQVLVRDPSSSRVMGELAQALFLRDKNQMSAAIVELAHSAIEKDPHNTTALGLAGIHAFENRDYPAAIDYWERTLRLINPHSSGARSLQASIERARQGLAQGEGADAVDGEGESDSGSSVRFEVTLAERVQARPDQWVYIYARAWQGSPMPLAITRAQVQDLPATIILDDTMAMSTMATLSQANQVELVARISQAGEATARPGDWQGTLGPLNMAQQPEQIQLKIDHQVPEK
jgi:cytochrome c-type biogenesis protein CcmH